MFNDLSWLPPVLLALGYMLFKNQTWWPLVVAFLRKLFPAPTPGPTPPPEPGKIDWQTLLQELLARLEAQHGVEGRLAVEQTLAELQIKDLQARMNALQPVNTTGKGGAT